MQELLKDRSQLVEDADRKSAADAVLIAQLTKQLETSQQKLTDLTRGMPRNRCQPQRRDG
jgi:hypothetical protein